jgi:integrase
MTDFSVVNRTGRSKLPVRKGEPYWHFIAPGKHLGYRKTGKAEGRWIARYYNAKSAARQRYQSLGVADDTVEANGIEILSFEQATKKAEDWFNETVENDRVGVQTTRKPYTVADAAKAWLDNWKGSERSKATSEANVRHYILPTFTDVPLRDLTYESIDSWLNALATMPPVRVQERARSTKRLAPSRQSKIVYNPDDPETKRKRKDTANRIFNDLRALLNAAAKKGKVARNGPWMSVDKLENASKASSEGLSPDEAKRFIAACPPDFLLLVQAALITGCRYADLCQMKVKAYIERFQAVEVRQSKTGEMQCSYLTDEEAAFFIKQIEGKRPDDFIFLRSDSKPWGKSHQQDRMRDALKAAKINRPIRFHDLRHTVGQWMAESGMSLKIISKQLGHSSVKVTEKHYVKYTPEFLSRTVRANKPSFVMAG